MEITVEVDEDGAITVVIYPDSDYILSAEDGNLVITLPDADEGTVINVDLPDDWTYAVEEDEDGNVIVILTPPTGYEVVEDEDGEFILQAKDDRELHRAYMFGNPAGYFRPGATITRAEVAAILVRTELRDFDAFTPETRELPDGMDRAAFDATFSDVGEHQWFYYYVAWAYDAGLITGFTDGTFRPGQAITRQEIAAMIARLPHIDVETAGTPVGIVDFDETQAWARDYVYTVYSAGLMQGNAQNEFRPRAHITRAETATVFNRNLGRLDSLAAYELADVTRGYARDFPDVDEANAAGNMPWFFPSVLSAANDHFLTRDADTGTITEVYVRYEQPWHD